MGGRLRARRSRSRPPPTATPGPPSTAPPPAPAAPRRSTSPAPAATCGCTARSAAPATATRCGSSRSTAVDGTTPPTDGPGYVLANPGHRRDPVDGDPAADQPADHPPRVPGELLGRAGRTCPTTRSSSRACRARRTRTRSWATPPPTPTRTLASLQAGGTACITPGDKSGYWMPTLYNGDTAVQPVGRQVIYYKSGVIDYRSVRPFPPGLRYVVGSPAATLDQFRTHPARSRAGSAATATRNCDFPAYCPAGSQLNVRTRRRAAGTACTWTRRTTRATWRTRSSVVCPASHPVAVPMIEFKMAFPVSGDMSQVRLASGRGYSFHYDFFNAWDAADPGRAGHPLHQRRPAVRPARLRPVQARARRGAQRELRPALTNTLGAPPSPGGAPIHVYVPLRSGVESRP